MLTRKHFQAVADILAESRPGPDADYEARQLWGELRERFADYFAANNPNFDATRFLYACQPDSPFPAPLIRPLSKTQD